MSKKRKRHRKEFAFVKNVFHRKNFAKSIDKALKRCYNEIVNRKCRKAGGKENGIHNRRA